MGLSLTSPFMIFSQLLYWISIIMCLKKYYALCLKANYPELNILAPFRRWQAIRDLERVMGLFVCFLGLLGSSQWMIWKHSSQIFATGSWYNYEPLSTADCNFSLSWAYISLQWNFVPLPTTGGTCVSYLEAGLRKVIVWFNKILAKAWRVVMLWSLLCLAAPGILKPLLPGPRWVKYGWLK